MAKILNHRLKKKGMQASFVGLFFLDKQAEFYFKFLNA